MLTSRPFSCFGSRGLLLCLLTVCVVSVSGGSRLTGWNSANCVGTPAFDQDVNEDQCYTTSSGGSVTLQCDSNGNFQLRVYSAPNSACLTGQGIVIAGGSDSCASVQLSATQWASARTNCAQSKFWTSLVIILFVCGGVFLIGAACCGWRCYKRKQAPSAAVAVFTSSPMMQPPMTVTTSAPTYGMQMQPYYAQSPSQQHGYAYAQNANPVMMHNYR